MVKVSKNGMMVRSMKVMDKNYFILISYLGYWMHDKANGHGYLIDKHQSKMTGAWRDNKLNGFAIKEKKNGDKYEGF